jgi:hypothetical protein
MVWSTWKQEGVLVRFTADVHDHRRTKSFEEALRGQHPDTSRVLLRVSKPAKWPKCLLLELTSDATSSDAEQVMKDVFTVIMPPNPHFA